MIELLSTEYVSVAVNCTLLQYQQDKVGEFFREVAERGHYAGRTKPSATRQGFYAVAPNGKLLSSGNTESARHAMATMFQGVRQWKAGVKDQKFDKIPESVERDSNTTVIVDDTAIILRETIRDLPRGKQTPLESWRHNFDHVWVAQDEARSLIPETIEVDATTDVDKKLLRRLTLFHLVDHVRGEATPWNEDDVKRQELKSKIVRVTEKTIEIQLNGIAKMVQPPSGELNPYTNHRVNKDRGVDLLIVGHASFDRESKTFTELQLLAVGNRWGTDVYNFRNNDMESAPIGFAFEMIENKPGNQMPPAFATWGAYHNK